MDQKIYIILQLPHTDRRFVRACATPERAAVWLGLKHQFYRDCVRSLEGGGCYEVDDKYLVFQSTVK